MLFELIFNGIYQSTYIILVDTTDIHKIYRNKNTRTKFRKTRILFKQI